MRVVWSVVGLLLILLGGVWMGQGAGFIGGSFMSGDATWEIIGGVVAVFGLILIFSSNFRKYLFGRSDADR